MSNSTNFIAGIAILYNFHVAHGAEVNVVEQSGIWIGNLGHIPVDVQPILKSLGWDIQYNKEKNSWSAQYHQLEYADY